MSKQKCYAMKGEIITRKIYQLVIVTNTEAYLQVVITFILVTSEPRSAYEVHSRTCIKVGDEIVK